MSTIAYTRQGSGPPLVLVHGIGHRRQAWDAVVDDLAADHDVIAVDLPGHGTSPDPTAPQDYSFDSVAAQLEDLFDDLGVGRPHVAGNSLGGYLTLLLAERGSVASATCLSPASFWTRPELFGVAATALLVMKATSYAPAALTRRSMSSPAARKAALRSLYRHGDRIPVETALADTANLRSSSGFWPFFWKFLPAARGGRSPQVPVTIAWGDHDRLLVPKQARRAAEQLPQATHVTLADCGHVPMPDDPRAVAGVIRTQVAAAARPVAASA